MAEKVVASTKASQGPGPLPESGSLVLSNRLLAEPSRENDTLIKEPSSEYFAFGVEAARRERDDEVVRGRRCNEWSYQRQISILLPAPQTR